MALSVPYTFVDGLASSGPAVNANFAALVAGALDKAGDTMTGTLTTPGITVSGTGATTLTVGGGVTAGTGSVAIIDTTGKIPDISTTYFASLSGANLTALAASALTGALPALNAASLTDLNASNLASGTVPTARLGSGSASSGNYLRGDSTWATLPASLSIPSGTIWMYGAAAAPTDYLLCDGSTVSRTTYSALFAVIGTTFGVGDGTTTFNVPDLRGRFPLGKAASGTGSTLGATGGAIDHTHTGPSHTHTGPSHMHTGPAHTHTFSGTTTGTDGPFHPVDTSSGSPSFGLVGDHDHDYSGTTGSDGTGNTGAAGTGATGADGTGASGVNNPPYLALNFIIKT